MTVGAILALLMPALASYLMLRRLSAALPGSALAAAVAPGLGLGFASCVYFALLHATANRTVVVRLDAGFWLIATFCLLVDARRHQKALPQGARAPEVAAAATTHDEARAAKAPNAAPAAPWTPAVVATAAGFVVLAALAVFAFWLRWTIRPEGEWDAFAIWNLRARAIARGAPDWAAIFSPALEWSSPHYPLLVPLSVARLWAYTGRESTAVPAAVALLFFLSSIAVVVIGVGRLRGWPIGLLSGMALLMARTYIYQGACQCGDVPVGFYMLVAIACVGMSLQATPGQVDRPVSDHLTPLLLTAGAAAGLAAWTKDEGLPLLALVVLAMAFRAPRLRSLAGVAAGAAVPVVALIVFKRSVETSNYLFGQQGGGVVQKLVDPSRWITVGKGLVDFGSGWGAVPGGALVCLALAVALTARPSRRSAIRASSGLLLIVAMMSGYGLVYVITPLPLEWQMAVSFDRLFVQLWPALVWAAFQFSGSPSAPSVVDRALL